MRILLQYRFWIIGSIVVCAAIVGSLAFFTRAQATDIPALVAACEKQGAQTQQCLNDLVLAQAHDRGIGAGFDALAAAYAHDAEFAAFCHGSTHELGKIAYADFKVGKDIELSSKTSYCGFGFFHGFMESLLQDSGTIDEARKFCAYVDDKLKASVGGVTFACYHGMGHGVIDGSDTSLWGDSKRFIQPGLDLCEKLGSTDMEKNWCGSGVFNAFAIHVRDPKYKLNIDPLDAYAICRAQTKSYFKIACYDQMNSYFVESTADFGEALRASARSAAKDPGAVPHAVESVAGYEVLRVLQSTRPAADYLKDCAALSGELADSCTRGFANGLVEFGKPGAEYDVALPMCAVAGAQMMACAEGIATAVRDRLSPAIQQKLCSDMAHSLGDTFGTRCREIMVPSPQ